MQTEINITTEVVNSYEGYALSVLSDRAIPDVRDGLKPSQRRVLVALRDLKVFSKAKHRKSALIAGHVSGFYHPHGEAVVYPTMVRMAQPFSLRYPLIDGQGNFGNIGGSPPAAMRYTEARMTASSENMMEDLIVDGHWTVKSNKNYDETRDEPSVLPSKFPNLIANGSTGIAVGWRTEIPSANIKEVVDGIIALIKDKDFSDEELFKLVKGPDFPTGGIIHGTSGITALYKTGAAQLTVSGRARIEQKKGTNIIVVYELPYGVSTDHFFEKADDAFKKGKLVGVSSAKDASSMKMGKPINVLFYLKRGVDPQEVLNQLFDNTPLRETYSANMIALVEGKNGERIPSESLSLRKLIFEWLNFRREVLTKKTEFNLIAIKKEIERINALIAATADGVLDKVIDIIKTKNNETEIVQELSLLLNLKEDHIKYILAITLKQLSKLEKDSLLKLKTVKDDQSNKLTLLLNNKKGIDDIIINDLLEIKQAYGDDRRTTILEKEVEKREVKKTASNDPPVEMYANISTKWNFKRTDTPLKDLSYKSVKMSSKDTILIITNKGLIYGLRGYEIPTQSTSVESLIKMSSDEHPVKFIPVVKFDNSRSILFVTDNGMIKRTELSEYENARISGMAAIKLDQNFVESALLVSDKDQVIITTKLGYCLRVECSELSTQGRNTSGRCGIKFKIFNDKVFSILKTEKTDTKNMLLVNKSGQYKKLLVSDIPTSPKYATYGELVFVTETASPIVGSALKKETESVMFFSAKEALKKQMTELKLLSKKEAAVKISNEIERIS